MSDSGPKTDAKPGEPSAAATSDSAEPVATDEEGAGDDLISEAELDREILEASPNLQALVGDLQKAEFKVSGEEKTETNAAPAPLPARLRASAVRLRRGFSVFLLLLENRRKRVMQRFKSFTEWYQKLSKFKKAAFVVWILAVFGVVIYAAKIYRGHILTEANGPYHFSLDDEAQSNTIVDEKEKWEPLYDNIRISPNIFLLPKIVVNIHASASSTSNPMAALELYVDSISSEAILEIKDHEPAVLDKVQRRIEEFTFDELQTVDGKKHLCQEVTNTINSVITQGTVRRTLIKTVFLKP